MWMDVRKEKCVELDEAYFQCDYCIRLALCCVFGQKWNFWINFFIIISRVWLLMIVYQCFAVIMPCHFTIRFAVQRRQTITHTQKAYSAVIRLCGHCAFWWAAMQWNIWKECCSSSQQQQRQRWHWQKKNRQCTFWVYSCILIKSSCIDMKWTWSVKFSFHASILLSLHSLWASNASQNLLWISLSLLHISCRYRSLYFISWVHVTVYAASQCKCGRIEWAIHFRITNSVIIYIFSALFCSFVSCAVTQHCC